MKKAPNSKTNLDRAIQRFAANPLRANALRNLMANAIVAQLIGDGVVKGGTGLKFRYGEGMTRATMDLDTARRDDLDSFLKGLSAKLLAGWHGFTGSINILRQASPRGIPFEYLMQPCEVKLSYLGRPWYTVLLEIGHNEIGDADAAEMIGVPQALAELFGFLSIPAPAAIPAMPLEFQVAQKLHGVSAPNSKRAHDLIDLQLIMAKDEIDLRRTKEICQRLFAYRKTHAWPPTIVKGENWEAAYAGQLNELPALQTVDAAVDWANLLIGAIDGAD